jgi:hypothetical protein
VNQIDDVLVHKTKRGMIQDVRTMRGPKCDTDHFLLKIKVKQSLIISQMKKKELTRWNSENLRNKQKMHQDRQLLYHKLQDKEVQQNINHEWTNIKDAILLAATEIITTEQVKQRNAWWDEECRDAIKQKNKARDKCLQRRTKSNQEDNEQKRKIANKICRQKKKAWMYTKLKDIEMANKKNDTKKFYKDVQDLSRGPPSSLQICEDDAGKLLIEKEEILKRWKQYFEQMMKRDITHISQETETTVQEHEEL